jgi:hypothetical protein
LKIGLPMADEVKSLVRVMVTMPREGSTPPEVRLQNDPIEHSAIRFLFPLSIFHSPA